MKNKIILLLFLVSVAGLSSCNKAKPTVSFINDLKEESRTPAKDGSFIYSHYLNVEFVRFKNEQKLKKNDTVAHLKLYHLNGFKKLVGTAAAMNYRLFAGDSTEKVYAQKDSALMVLMGISVTITNAEGRKLVVVNDLRVPNQTGTAKIPYITDTTNVNGRCIGVREHISAKITNEANIYYKNLDLYILNNPVVFTKNQKYKLHFRIFDKIDPNRYFEGETRFTAY